MVVQRLDLRRGGVSLPSDVVCRLGLQAGLGCGVAIYSVRECCLCGWVLVPVHSDVTEEDLRMQRLVRSGPY